MKITLRRTVASLALVGAILGSAAAQAAAAPLATATETGSGVLTSTVAPLENFAYAALQGVLNAASGRPAPTAAVAPGTAATTTVPAGTSSATSGAAAATQAGYENALYGASGLGILVGAAVPKA
ncbi:hypothetical protein [Streptomyces sp. NPDC056361]|uniref:hypothetical protein n=1 Tax=Streptomyces sp. NPDC056361 TaxID=3345795 RepID=UPI0035D77712